MGELERIDLCHAGNVPEHIRNINPLAFVRTWLRSGFSLSLIPGLILPNLA